MRVVVRIRTRDASDALRAYTLRRLQFSIARFADRLSHVSVRVADAEGNAGQRQYACRVEVEIRPSGGPLVEEVVDRDVYTAIDLATDRLGGALRRRLVWGVEARGAPQLPPPDGTASEEAVDEVTPVPAVADEHVFPGV